MGKRDLIFIFAVKHSLTSALEPEEVRMARHYFKKLRFQQLRSFVEAAPR